MKFADKGDQTERFSLWKQRMEIYSQITDKKNDHLVPYILQGLDDEGLKIYNAFNLTPAERVNPQRILEKFEVRLKITKPNFRAAQLDLYFCYQGKDESMDHLHKVLHEISRLHFHTRGGEGVVCRTATSKYAYPGLQKVASSTKA